MTTDETVPAATAHRWWVPMTGRDSGEPHRAATPLELLFDLTFVVAVAQLASRFAHDVAEGHVGHGVGAYAMVFFAIWWAWMNFTWFASAYDTDDVAYRVLTVVQMAGVLVLAAGVPAAFDDNDFRAATTGYVIMRLAMVAQWLRAAREDPSHRPAARRYALGITLVQVCWVVRLLVPGGDTALVFVLLALVDTAVPVWAERPGMSTWHPHHIAERYGLFTILVLGECVLAASTALEPAIGSHGWGPEPVLVGGGALGLVVGLWWLYFLHPSGHQLARRRDRSFMWGYGQSAVFAGIAALGAGLEVAAESLAHEIHLGDRGIGLAVAVPTALVLVLMWAAQAPLAHRPLRGLVHTGVTAAAVLTVGVTSGSLLSVPVAVALMAVPVAALVAFKVVTGYGTHIADE